LVGDICSRAFNDADVKGVRISLEKYVLVVLVISDPALELSLGDDLLLEAALVHEALVLKDRLHRLYIVQDQRLGCWVCLVAGTCIAKTYRWLVLLSFIVLNFDMSLLNAYLVRNRGG